MRFLAFIDDEYSLAAPGVAVSLQHIMKINIASLRRNPSLWRGRERGRGCLQGSVGSWLITSGCQLLRQV